VEMATGDQIADSYIQMASEMIFQKSTENQGTVIEFIQPEYSQPRIDGQVRRENIGQRFVL